jgi:hypothetical protein
MLSPCQAIQHDAKKYGIIKKRLILIMPLVMVYLALANPETDTISAVNASFSGKIPEEVWNRTFGGSGDDVGTYIAQTNDGGYIITGYTSSYGVDAPYSWIIKAQYRGDIWLIKTDSEGNKIWDRTFGGLGKDLGFCVQQTKDNGYIITGCKKLFLIGNYDVYLIKTDPKGNKEWEKTFGGSNEDVGFSVLQAEDGGYVIAGYTSFSEGKMVWLIKTDSEGNKEWERTIGRKDSEAASIQQTNDGSYIIAGYTTLFDTNKDVWLIKTNSEGDWEWFKNFGGPNKDIGMSVQETQDGGFIITGLTESYGTGKGDVWLIKTNSTGAREWDKTFGGPDYDLGSSVQQTKDGGYIITGYNTTSSRLDKNQSWLFSLAGLGRVYLIKTDSNGNEEWEETFGGSRSDWGNSVLESQDGGYVIAGVTESYGAGKQDVWMIKVK